MSLRLTVIALALAAATALAGCSSTAGSNTTYTRPAASPAAIQIPLN